MVFGSPSFGQNVPRRKVYVCFPTWYITERVLVGPPDQRQTELSLVTPQSTVLNLHRLQSHVSYDLHVKVSLCVPPTFLNFGKLSQILRVGPTDHFGEQTRFGHMSSPLLNQLLFRLFVPGTKYFIYFAPRQFSVFNWDFFTSRYLTKCFVNFDDSIFTNYSFSLVFTFVLIRFKINVFHLF